eukprot:TRINITY_DN15444_c0_g1_i3.p1 TRINITY_DN15444_c0_g1~~TRINITY_DN15444_c0_g1_i3.p1  ORF type:complete len:107 (-),score=17.73 TRINITY_DN15444_c0_g1_i3:152-472(-)
MVREMVPSPGVGWEEPGTEEACFLQRAPCFVAATQGEEELPQAEDEGEQGEGELSHLSIERGVSVLVRSAQVGSLLPDQTSTEVRVQVGIHYGGCLLYTSPSPRDS